MRTVDDLVLRPVTEAEFAEWHRSIARWFGETLDEERTPRFRERWDLERTLAAFDGDRIVANGGAWTLDMSLPGADPAGCAGVTVIGVASDWRRRGVLTAMMRRLIDDARERGEPFAALYASESPIYGRFGYGVAAPALTLRVRPRDVQLVEAGDVAEVELVDGDEAAERFPAIAESHRRQRSGMMSRGPAWWTTWLPHDDASERDGMSPRFHAVLGDRGYAAYRLKPGWGNRGPAGELSVVELVANDPAAAAGLWAFLLGVDLVEELTASGRPVDDPLPLLVHDRNRVHVTQWEGMFLRLVDLPAALEARRYDVDARVMLEVTDAFCPWNAGRWALEVADGRGRCTPTDEDADLVLDTRELAGMFLGGVDPLQLWWAGRLDERTPGAVARLRRLFATERAPWNPFEF